MQSFTAECVVKSLILFISALNKIGIEFSVITFGEKVSLLKDAGSEWTSTHSWILLSQLTFEDYASLDADAIHCGLDLLVSGKGPKSIFVLTDGYGTSGRRLPVALQRAHLEGVEVLAVAVGMDSFGVSHSYPSWIECALPKYIPEALRNLCHSEEASLSVTNEGRKWHEFYMSNGNDSTIAEILAEHRPVFSQDLNTERNAEVHVDNNGTTTDLSVDICFVTDLTGSMTPFVEVVLTQISQIIRGVQDAGRVQYPNLEIALRISFVGFGDEADSSKYLKSTLPFTAEKERAIKFVERQLQRVGGGGDLAEDVCGGLSVALGLDWQSSSRALILITDAPGHGREMNNGTVEDSLPNAPGPGDLINKMLQNNINFIFCRINKAATAVMERTFKRYYAADPTVDCTFESVPLVLEDSTPVQAGAVGELVYILCLDESGSMSGQKWTDLLTAYTEFLKRLNRDQGVNKRIAVINFDSTARFVCGRSPQPVSIQSAPKTLPFAGGGTDFTPPMRLVGDVMSHPSCARSKFVLLFMTDGQGDGPGSLVANYAAQYQSRFVMHSVGFGADVDHAKMQSLTAGGGRYHATLTGSELLGAFVKIAADTETANRLPVTIVNKIMDTAVTRLVLDYL